MSESGFEGMRLVPVSRDETNARGWLDHVVQAEREIKIFLDVNGVPTPIRNCDWVLARPCGCVVSIMSACSLVALYATEADAWHEFYDTDPHPHRRVREARIHRMQADGWTVRAETRTEAVRLFQAKADHEHDTTKE